MTKSASGIVSSYFFGSRLASPKIRSKRRRSCSCRGAGMSSKPKSPSKLASIKARAVGRVDLRARAARVGFGRADRADELLVVVAELAEALADEREQLGVVRRGLVREVFGRRDQGPPGQATPDAVRAALGEVGILIARDQAPEELAAVGVAIRRDGREHGDDEARRDLERRGLVADSRARVRGRRRRLAALLARVAHGLDLGLELAR